MKKVYVALITPFDEKNEIDYIALELLIKRLMQEGCNGFIVCGTTGESCTLNEEEKFALLSFVLKVTKHQVEIYFGCGSNNTQETLRMCRKAQNYDIDGVLLVTPYYNKPSQEGLYQHYATIATNCTLPIILYQVESRCNCIFEVDTLKRLVHDYPSIKALKYASKDMEKAILIKKEVPALHLLCGDDNVVLECDKVGMDGIISVIAHIVLPEFIAFYQKGQVLNDFYFKRICRLVFVESNPVGIKYVLHQKYGFSESVRLPLVPLTNEHKKMIDAYFDK